jgi:hypothetical protein
VGCHVRSQFGNGQRLGRLAWVGGWAWIGIWVCNAIISADLSSSGFEAFEEIVAGCLVCEVRATKLNRHAQAMRRIRSDGQSSDGRVSRFAG